MIKRRRLLQLLGLAPVAVPLAKVLADVAPAEELVFIDEVALVHPSVEELIHKILKADVRKALDAAATKSFTGNS